MWNWLRPRQRRKRKLCHLRRRLMKAKGIAFCFSFPVEREPRFLPLALVSLLY
jgi:hypothetical protein